MSDDQGIPDAIISAESRPLENSSTAPETPTECPPQKSGLEYGLHPNSNGPAIDRRYNSIECPIDGIVEVLADLLSDGAGILTLPNKGSRASCFAASTE